MVQQRSPESGLGDFQEFLASGTWVKPLWAKLVIVECIGSGGGGGGGEGRASTNLRIGGGGGRSWRMYDAGTLAGEETITIGAGGTSGAGGSSNDGSNGGAGADANGTTQTGFGGVGGKGLIRVWSLS